MSRNRRTVFLLLTVMWVIGAILEVSIGPVRIPISRILPASIAYFTGSHLPDAVVMGNIRLPRMVVALFVGAGLGASGAVLQAIFRNSMADPGIIGVSSGGSLGAVILMATGGADLSRWMLPIGAFIASLLTVFIIFRLGTVKGRTSVHSLLLSGVAVSALCSSIVTLILSVSDQYNMKRMLFWLMGGLE
ncbi:MAG: transport system permease protein, partial [Bacilli bacterium]|nr:transport system permease protein [Bacilli bacterium]